MTNPVKVVVVDVDGVVSAVHPTAPTWGDEVVAGTVFGPVMVSPMLCRRLDSLAAVPGVECVWLTSWDEDMRAGMDPFPGPGWVTVAGPEEALTMPDDAWWKLTALEGWLDTHPEVTAVAWCDDHLRGGRPAAIRRRFAARGVDVLFVRPASAVGLTPGDLDTIETWARTERCDPSPAPVTQP